MRLRGRLAFRLCLIDKGEDLYLLNRGNRNGEFAGKVKEIIVKDVNDEEELKNAIGDMKFDVTTIDARRSYKANCGTSKQQSGL